MNPTNPKPPSRPPSSLERFVPGIRMLRNYRTAALPKDLAAGITLGTVMIPVGLALGELAGVPMAGLYAGILPLIVYALFGSSRQLIVGPDAAMATLVALSLAPLAGGDASRLAVLAAVLALLTGAICIAASLLRLGFLSDFLAKPIIAGFMHGIAVVIAIGQLPKLLGIAGGGDSSVQQLINVWHNLSNTNLWALGIGVSCIVIILSCKRWLPRVPGQIVALVFALLAVSLLGLQQHGVAVVGEIPKGLPSLHLPVFTLEDAKILLSLALGATLVSVSDTMATARGFASRNRYRIDANQEMMALGLGNIAASITQGLPISGSGSRTAAAEAAGSQTQVTSIVAALMVAFAMLFLTGLFASLPSAALGGILMAAAWNLCDFKEFKRMWHFSGAGLVGAIITLIGVVCIGVLEGIGLGVLYSLVLVIKALAFPDDAVLGKAGNEFRNTLYSPDATTIPGAVIYRFAAPLFFANCGGFKDRVEQVIQDRTDAVHTFVLDASAMSQLDLASCETLAELQSDLHARGIQFKIANLRSNVREILLRGWPEAAEKQLMFTSIEQALAT